MVVLGAWISSVDSVRAQPAADLTVYQVSFYNQAPPTHGIQAGKPYQTLIHELLEKAASRAA